MSKANDPRPSQGNAKRLIIAQGRTVGPFILQFFDGNTRRGRNRVARFRIWHGVDSGSAAFAGDRNGFEHVPSVEKTTSHEDLSEGYESSDGEDEDPISAQVPRSRRTTGGTLPTPVPSRSWPSVAERPIGSMVDAHSVLAATHAANSSIERSPGKVSQLKRPKKFELIHDGRTQHPGQSSRHDHISSQPNLCTTSSAERQGPPSSNTQSSYQHSSSQASSEERHDSLTQHIREYTEFWFMLLHGKHPPRIRPYHTCDTAKTLFGHARSARVFDPSPDVANVISIRMWDRADAMTLMEEDDPKFREQDYTAFLSSLREAASWIWLDGQWTGSCNIEVKAMD